MKKILLLISFCLVFVFSVLPVFASKPVQSEDAMASSGSAMVNVEYVLPYPGMLSDNPLYVIKALRDKITEILMADPSKKAEFYLLTADKRLNEGILLFDKGISKYSLGESTISKGENYFEKGIGQLQFAKKQNLDVNSLIQKYHLSLRKHQEVLKILIGKSTGSVKNGLIRSQMRLAGFEKMLDRFELLK